MRNTTILVLTLSAAAFLAGCSHSQYANRTRPVKRQVIVDEYSVLDDGNKKPISDRDLQRKLDEARQSYALALRLSDQGKTAEASQYFEQALSTLNDLTTYPSISSNEEFASLSENIMRDYEERTSIDSLDANSNFFVLRDKMLQEIGSIPVQNRKDRPNVTSDATSSFKVAMTDNAPVQQCIAFFTSDRGRKFFSKWLERSGRYFETFGRIMKEEGAPQELKFLSMIESGLNTNAVSRVKAVGLWQFMAATGQMYGLRLNWWIDERRNPEKATHAAARYLIDLYEELGDWHLALAAYNCGPGRMKSAISRSGGSRDYWVVRNYLPTETQKYVPLYIAAAKIASDPEAYGFTNLNYDKPDQNKSISLDYSLDFSRIAQLLELSTEELRSANPELLRGRTPPGVQYKLYVPGTTSDKLLAGLREEIDSLKSNTTWLTHRVVKGETVGSIAKKYNIPASDIYAYNSVKPPSNVHKGMALRIPVSKNAPLDSAQLADTDTTATGDDESDEDIPVETSRKAFRSLQDGSTGAAGSTFREITVPAEANKPDTAGQSSLVNRKDRGFRISELRSRPSVKLVSYKKTTSTKRTSPSKAYASNSRRNGRNDYRNDRSIFVRASYQSGRNSRTANESATRVIRRGETLSGLADRYGVSQKDLRKWNPQAIKKNKVLSGITLKLKGAAATKAKAIERKEKEAAIKAMKKSKRTTIKRTTAPVRKAAATKRQRV